MAIEIYDENKLRGLPDEERMSVCERIIKNDSDESKRWDAVYRKVFFDSPNRDL